MSEIDKQSLLDLYALTFKEDNYPPVAGKILGLFYISNPKYFTFEELMEEVGASKSAISKALKLLLERGDVNFTILKGSKRRRHFYLDTEGIVDSLQRLVDAYTMQTELLQETLTIRNEENEEMNLFITNLIKFNNEVLTYIDQKLKEHF